MFGSKKKGQTYFCQLEFLFYFDAFVKIQEVMEQARGDAQQPSAFQLKKRGGN